MLLRYLSFAGTLCLARPVASVDDDGPDSLHPYIPSVQTSSPLHELNLPCTRCAFSYSDCLGNVHPNAHLKVELSTREDVLLANGEVVFPAPFPRQFHATRYWDSSSEVVSLMFALDVLPLPRQPGSTLGDLYRLKLRLFDLQGRPATEKGIAVGLSRSRSEEGTLELFQVAEAPIHYHEYHQYDHDDNYYRIPHTGATHGSWRSYLTTYRHGKPNDGHPGHHPGDHDKDCVTKTTTEPSHNGTNVEVVTTICHAKPHHHSSLDEWRERNFSRLMRPVILHALLGIAAGIVTSVIGFLLGKIIASVYLYFQRGRGSRYHHPPRTTTKRRESSPKAPADADLP